MGIDNFKMYIDLLSNILLSYGQGLFDRFLEYESLFQNALRDSMHHLPSHQGAENMRLHYLVIKKVPDSRCALSVQGCLRHQWLW